MDGMRSISIGQDELCSSGMLTAASSCDTYATPGSLLPTNQAQVGVNWTIEEFGQYMLVVSVKHRSDVGYDEETIRIAALIVEYPAPPAIANAYINETPYYESLPGKRRGCVISTIAEHHAKESKYGPKGGPYNEEAVRAAVDLHFPYC